MSIEQAIDRLTTAIEGYTAVLNKAIAAQGGGKAPASETKPTKGAKEEAPAKAAKPKVGELGLVEVTALTTKAIKEHDKAAEVKEILSKFGVKKASELPESKWPSYVTKVKALIETEADEDEGEDDGDDDLI